MHPQGLSTRRIAILACFPLLLVLCSAVAAEGDSETELLARIGARASQGAAPGYLEDARCGVCHAPQFESFQSVGMARSLRRPRRAEAIEAFDTASILHAASEQYFRMRWEADGRLVLERWQLDADGARVNPIAQPVDWVLGSGHRARVYLYGNAAGELFQLPLAWYTQEGRWGMAPGYDRRDHDGFGRRIRRECLFCHNAYPEVASDSDAAWEPHVFPQALPEGIGCQRCHGPGAAHVATVLGGGAPDAIRAAIVNPRRLPRARRDDVCFQCHLQPAVAVMGLRRDGRNDYAFRPGEDLSDYLLHVDIEEAGRTSAQRFEINHHGYRLTRSRCHLEGGLGCIDCHDPHVALRRDPRLARVDATCAGCHPAAKHPAAGPRDAAVGAGCVQCHMPKRRTQDVVHVSMTDHAIPRQLPDAALAPLRESDPSVVDVQLFEPEAVASVAQARAYRARAVLHALPSAAALQALDASLAGYGPTKRTPWMDAVSGELRLGRFAAAAERIEPLLARWPEAAQLHGWHGVAALGTGRAEEAIAPLRRAIALSPEQAEFHLNLALALEHGGARVEAEASARRALQLRPNLVPAWLTLSRLQQHARQHDEALASALRALAWEPDNTRAWVAAMRAAEAAGDSSQARLLRSRAARFARHPARIPARDDSASRRGEQAQGNSPPGIHRP